MAPLKAGALESAEGTKLIQEADGTIQTSGPNPRQDDYRVISPVRLARITGIKLEVFPHASNSEGRLSRGASGEFLLTDIKVQVRRRGGSQIRDILVRGAIADYIADKKKNNNYGDIADTLDDDPRNGWTTLGADPRQPHTGIYALAEPLTLAPDEDLIFEMRHRSTTGDANIGRFRVSVTDQPGPALESLQAAPLEQLSKLDAGMSPSPELRQRLFNQFLTAYSPYLLAKEALDRATRQRDEMKGAGTVNVMVLADLPKPRETNVLLRGVWDKKGEKVEPGIIPAIASWPAPEHPDDTRNRLGLAHWLTSRQNPLTAR